MSNDERHIDLDRVDGFLFDIDGTLVLGDKPGGEGGRALPGAVELLEHLRARDVPVAFCTNGSNKPPSDYATHLRHAGIEVSDHECFTPALVSARVIEREVPDARVMVLGGPSLAEPLRERDIEIVPWEAFERANAILVGNHMDVTGRELEAACKAAWNGAALFVTSNVSAYAVKGGRAVGVAGAVAAAITHVSGLQPTVTGKPAAEVMAVAAEMTGIAPDRMAVVGDDLRLEIAMARATGATGILVLTGTSKAAEAEALAAGDRPDLVVDDLRGVLDRLR
jgi:4-nitrophenyl phosphatase